MRRFRLLLLTVAIITVAGVAYTLRSRGELCGTVEPLSIAIEAHPEQVKSFCAACHAYPSPDMFPRDVWRKEIRQAYDFLRDSTLSIEYPPLEDVVLYYEKHAPQSLPVSDPPLAAPCPVLFDRQGYAPPEQTPQPGVAHLNLVKLFDATRLDVLTCDMRSGRVQVFQPYVNPPAWRTLAEVPHPAHAEVVDLDRDGINDVVVADLGNFSPTDDHVGRVVWLRQAPAGVFTPIVLLDGVGRVADVQAADFNGDGKLDLVVAAFGWRETGEILWLENSTTDWASPNFVPHTLDRRHGTIHVPVADLNGDGKPDFVALISQEHESVVAFLNEGNGKFRSETLYAAPHPGFGYSGLQLVDLDGDGDLDMLLTNGDSLQKPYILKPYHGIHWLENLGGLKFKHHEIAAMPGAMRAVAADFDGDGRQDIAAVSYLPAGDYPQRVERNLDAVVLLRQIAKGRFERHVLESGSCDHLTCAAGDLDGDSRIDLVAGNFTISPAHPLRESICIWRHRGLLKKSNLKNTKTRNRETDFGFSLMRPPLAFRVVEFSCFRD